jgi:putative transposase
MNNLIYDRTTVYNIGYHIVWSVKYRCPVIKGPIEKALKQILFIIADEKGFIIKELEVMQDHVHVFVSAKPKISPSYIYKMLKGISSRRLFMEYPEIRNKLWDGHLWNPSTYVETIGHISEEAVKKYIQDQKRK